VETILWLLAVLLVVAGIWKLFNREFFIGVLLIVLGLLIGPGGVSLLL